MSSSRDASAATSDGGDTPPHTDKPYRRQIGAGNGPAIMRFEFAAEPWLLDKLAVVGSAEEDVEDDDPGEEEPDLEEEVVE